MTINITIMLSLSTNAGIKCPIPEVAMATLTPSTEPVDFESMLMVTCHTGYVINGTSDDSKTYSCLATGHFDVSLDVCVGELCLCVFVHVCWRKRYSEKQNKA